GGAAQLDVDAAGDVLGRAAQIVLLAREPALEHVEVAAQALERGERIVDLDDLGRDAMAQPLARPLPGPEVARAVERERADRVAELAAAARAGHAIEQNLALAPRVGGELDAGAAVVRRGKRGGQQPRRGGGLAQLGPRGRRRSGGA